MNEKFFQIATLPFKYVNILQSLVIQYYDVLLYKFSYFHLLCFILNSKEIINF